MCCPGTNHERLESIASNVAPVDHDAGSIRQYRHGLRRAAGRLLPGERVRGCGRKRTGQAVDIHRTDKGAYFAGVETCGSVWLCPVCAAKIAEHRKEEVEAVIQTAQDAGGSVYMLTLTLRHDRTDALETLRSAVVDGWRKYQAHKGWRTFKGAVGLIGTVRALEVTYGANGWHPHLHILLVTDRAIEDTDAASLDLFSRWRGCLEKMGRDAKDLGLDFRPVSAGDYVAKWGTAQELVKGGDKTARKGSRNPWQLLSDYAQGDMQAGALFSEYATVFKGKRQLTWSRHLRAALNMGAEVEDAAIAAEADEQGELQLDCGVEVGRIGTLDHATFDAVARHNLTAQVLDAAHAGGWRAVEALLSAHGLKTIHTTSPEWSQPPQGGRPAHPKYYVTMRHEKLRSNTLNHEKD